MLVHDWLEESARRFPDKIALVAGGQRLSYGEIDERSNRLATLLSAHGIGRGERVIIYLENRAEAVVAIFGILKVGGVFVVINPSTKTDKLVYLLNNCRAAGLVTSTAKLSGADDALVRAPALRILVLTTRGLASIHIPSENVLFMDQLAGVSPKPVDNGCIDVDLAALIYTSGSTGGPKGVAMTHLNIVTAATSISSYLELRPEDVILSVLPLSFDYGLYQVLLSFQNGATLILERSFTYPGAVLDRIVEEQVTTFPLVPTMAAILLRMDLRNWDLSSLRYITNTAAALPTEHIEKLRKAFPKVSIFSMYGLTECKRVSYLPPEELDRRPCSVGKAIPNTEAYIVDDAGQRVGPGVVGELVIRGSHIMRGYWEMPEATDGVLKPGAYPWEKVLYSGDLFRMDEEGYLYFVGRKDEMLKVRGEKVSPREIEDVLTAMPGVAEAAVLGVPDEILGQAIKVVISTLPHAALTENDVFRYCASRLEDYMLPTIVEFRQELPKNANGKTDKRSMK